MLIHKRTMGVLDTTWKGAYHTDNLGHQIPVQYHYTLKDVSDPDEWWEVSSTSTIAATARAYYPDITPVTDEDGNLISVKIITDSKPEKDLELEEQLKQLAELRGYSSARFNLRPKNMMPFLKP